MEKQKRSEITSIYVYVLLSGSFFLRSHTIQNVISVFSYNTLSLVISVEMRKFVYFFGLHNSGNHPFLASQRALIPLPPPAA